MFFTQPFCRYVLICHSTKPALLNKKVLLIWSISPIISSVLAVSYHLTNFWWNQPYNSPQDYFTRYKRKMYFLAQCDSLYSRDSRRLVFEIIICFAFPAIVSGMLYARIIFRLLKRKKETARNRSLTVAFLLSWLYWIICWTPYYYGLLNRGWQKTIISIYDPLNGFRTFWQKTFRQKHGGGRFGKKICRNVSG